MKTTLLSCLALFVLLTAAPFARAIPDKTQLHVTVSYTRTVNWKERLGPDNYQTTTMNFSMSADWRTLAMVTAPQEFETWPRYDAMPTQSRITALAKLDGKVRVDRNVREIPEETEYHYSGNQVVFENVNIEASSSFPVNPKAMRAKLGFQVPLTPADPRADKDNQSGVCAMSYSPVTDGGGQHPLHVPVEFHLLPEPGPRPDGRDLAGQVVQRTYDLDLALSWGGAAIPSHGAPSLNWVGAVTTKGPQGLPIIQIKQSKKWTDEQGEVIDTLTATITPEPINLKPAEPAAPAPAEEQGGYTDIETEAAKYVAEVMGQAKAILRAAKSTEDAAPLLEKYFASRHREIPESERALIVDRCLTALVEKGILKEASAQ